MTSPRCARTIAVDTYSGYASALFEILDQAGIDFQHDLTVVLAGATNLRFTRLLQGGFTATLLGSPVDRLAEARGFRSLTHVLGALGGYQGVVFAAHRGWLDRNAAVARALTSVFADAITWAARPASRPALRGILLAGLPAGTTPAVVDGIADRLFGATTDFCPPGTVALPDLQEVKRLFEKYRKVDLSGFDVTSVVDARFVRVTAAG